MRIETETQKLVSRIESGLHKEGISVGDFCKHAMINRATWQRWKAGDTTPHPSMLVGIELAYKAALSSLQAQK